MGNHAPKQWPERAGTDAAEPRAMKASGTTTSPPPIYESDVDATDAARDLASLHDVDLRKVTGTGADGRITKDDVLAVVDQQD